MCFLSILTVKEGDWMEAAKKRIRIIMVCVVLAAITVGLVYYYHENQDKTVSERGTLIAECDMGWHLLWQ